MTGKLRNIYPISTPHCFPSVPHLHPSACLLSHAELLRMLITSCILSAWNPTYCQDLPIEKSLAPHLLSPFQPQIYHQVLLYTKCCIHIIIPHHLITLTTNTVTIKAQKTRQKYRWREKSPPAHICDRNYSCAYRPAEKNPPAKAGTPK